MVRVDVVALLAVGWLAAGCPTSGVGNCVTCTDDGTSVGDDDGDTDDPVVDPDAPRITIEVTADNGVAPYTVVFEDIQTSWDDRWAFLARSPTDMPPLVVILAMTFAHHQGLGTYTMSETDNSDDNYGSLFDTVTFGNLGTFDTESGTVEVTRWEEAVPGVPGSYLMDGTLDVHFSNGWDATDVLDRVDADVVGDFANLSLVVDTAR